MEKYKEREGEVHHLFEKNGEPAGTRTRDTLIKSQVLYQLSYRPSSKCGLLYGGKWVRCQGLFLKTSKKYSKICIRT